MREIVDQIDATPSKRLYLSIIADYDLNKAICELVDNVLDLWLKGGKNRQILIEVELNEDQQTIRVTDNAGGVRKSDLHFIVGPGQTSDSGDAEIIGIFGVGTKRAVVALAQSVHIKTRYGKGKTYLVEFDDSWIESDDWGLPLYEAAPLPPNTTVVELQKLRLKITAGITDNLKQHLRATYARFLRDSRVVLRVDGENLRSVHFEDWSYPPNYSPREFRGTLSTPDGEEIRARVIAGLTKESSPATGEYGVYVYCNERLVGRALRSYDVGFTKGLAGLPHPSASLCRVMVYLNGPPRLMPWNSSKSGIYPNHKMFVSFQEWLVKVVTYYASLSRRLEGDWPQQVFKYSQGKVQRVTNVTFARVDRLYLPPLPKARPRYGDLVKHANQKVAREKPWTKGLYEGVIAVDLISKQRLEQKNRICLILLDSNLEIAFKEFLVHGDSVPRYSNNKLRTIFANRLNVHKEVQQHTSIDTGLWQKIEYYYDLRCKLVHERATVGISDPEVDDFRNVLETVLKKLFRLKFKNLSRK